MTTTPTEDRCPVCAGGLRLYARRPESVYAAASTFDIHRCDDCACGVTRPAPTPEEIAATYDNAYDYSAHTLIASEKRWRSRRMLRHLQTDPFDSVLDVGCMYGYLLQEARDLGVARTEGVELAEAPALWARAQGSPVFLGTLEKYASTGPAAFDVIVAQHVLEHIRDFDGFVRTAMSLLRPGGRLVLCVPHFGSRTQRWFRRSWGWYQLPVHLQHFSPAAIRRLAPRSGAEVEEISFNGGDSLFVLLTLMYATVGPPRGTSRTTALRKVVIALASWLLRPYYFVGDEEMFVILRKSECAVPVAPVPT